MGRHSAAYKGYREGKGIWGNWSIQPIRGGFQIWPLSDGAPLQAETESDEVEATVALRSNSLAVLEVYADESEMKRKAECQRKGKGALFA